MKLTERFLTENPCYTAGRKITVKGLMLHSVGCPQPKAEVFTEGWNTATAKVCVHAFIDAEDGAVWQTLPWDYKAWHCGGSGNASYIGVEMCEPECIRYTSGSSFTCSDAKKARAAAEQTYETAAELFAELCRKYALDPLKDGVILSHKEGHRRGIASDHADPEHLWRQLGLPYTMDTFRKAVKTKMDEKKIDNTPSAWAKAAVDWAVENGLMTGGSDGDLMLRSPVTREQFCVILKRYHEVFGK